MARSDYWADNYAINRKSAEEAIGRIKSGQRVFLGSSCGEPQHLVAALAAASTRFTDLEILRVLSLETTPLTLIANASKCQNFNIRSFYLGSGKPRVLAENRRFITPMNLSALPRLFRTGQFPIHAALIQVSPPDDFGWMSLGVSVDVTLAAALSADLVIAQVNPQMPRVLGRSFIHVNDVDVFVEHEEELLTIQEPPESESANTVGKLIARLIDDGSTLHISPGASPHATLLALTDKNDLGVHTEYLTDGLMHLVAKGVINNRVKGNKEGRMVASSAIGTKNLYEFIHDNPSIDFQPSEYVNDPGVIARNNKMVSMSVPMAVDLTGQVAADALQYNYFAGVSGMLDFVRGSSMSPGGKSILMLNSTGAKGQRSRIIPSLGDTAVVVPRGDVQYVVTEYGVVNLFGKSLQERAMAMISIAHPDYRDELFQRAKEMKLLGAERTLRESLHGIYPVKYEEVVEIDGEEVTIRPAKPVDERRIQEHYYNLDKADIFSRFFHEKSSFVHEEVEITFEIDYINDLTMVAVVGEFGFGRVVAVGEYLLEPAKNMAEIAFTVSKAWQGKGLSKLMLRKLSEAARDNGISGLVAYTLPQNQPMIGLFKKLPYKVKTVYEDDLLLLSCKFDDPVK